MSNVFICLIVLAGLIFALWLALFINKKIFGMLRKKHNRIHYMYTERLIKAAIVVAFIVSVITSIGGQDNIWKSVLGSTAVISAVVGFAAQDVLKNILAGMLISIHKPFDIGDRIVLDDETAGVVKEMNIRHVVLVGLDTVKIVIPNSVIASMKLRNFNFTPEVRSVICKFSVYYYSNTDEVKKIISNAIEESEYSIPVKRHENREPEYSKVYFLKISENALTMGVTVYFSSIYASEIVLDDINTRVKKALNANGIKTPYNYVNVVKEKLNTDS